MSDWKSRVSHSLEVQARKAVTAEAEAQRAQDLADAQAKAMIKWRTEVGTPVCEEFARELESFDRESIVHPHGGRVTITVRPKGQSEPEYTATIGPETSDPTMVHVVGPGKKTLHSWRIEDASKARVYNVLTESYAAMMESLVR